ncbi:MULTISPECIES: TniB family NTP-binding protein [unclassified Polaromonas]|uniref:TniB family NTP-binding protein n=1 Tax=unclassified Polaromonas TaxID=2638319 RepID=UPI000F07CAAF|nr:MULTISPECIES: TniB family NTP-binding protein [unclassified Polaromonas]AYQ27485.1 transposase [Polaromonas sp. SP1]QGJ17674.1 AAA family ATPase [Polaromonas sp. Pch-P]
MTQSEFPHLKDSALALINSSDQDRILAIRGGTWVNYTLAKETVSQLEDLLAYPQVTRMPNILLVAPSNNGKTSILERFVSLHPPLLDPESEVTVCPVLMIECPSSPDISAFYSRILDALMAPYKPTAPPQEKLSQIKRLFKSLGVRMLILDEIHHLIAGTLNKQKDFRNALKSLGNETKVVIVAAGIEDAYNAFATDPQMSSRFYPVELPTWKANADFGSLLITMESRTPLKKPSNLKDPAKMLALHTRSEGTLGDICDLFKALAVDAIKSGVEEITLERIGTLRWVPPSRRKQHRRL